MANEPAQTSAPLERKLVTILSADVAEYSRLMAEDEEHTLRVFKEHSATFAALVEVHHGRIFNVAGDAILAEFTSPVEAVRCATDIQAALRTRNETLPAKRQVKFRIGVNLGDVMTHNSDLLGDGVNVAARLQGAAEPGGITISGSVYDQIRNKLSLNIQSLGERQYKNIPQLVRTFTIAGMDEDGIALGPRKPSIDFGAMLKPIRAVVTPVTGALTLLVLVGGYFAYSTLSHMGSTPAEKPSATGTNTATASATTNTNGAKGQKGAPIHVTLDAQASALLSDAQKADRPKGEISDLTDANTKIAAVATQLRALKPADKAKTPPLLAQMNSLASDMGQNEVTALAHSGNAMAHDIASSPGKSAGAGAAAAISAAKDAKSKFDDAVTAAQQAKDGPTSLKGASDALAAYSAFAAAYATAAPFYVTARRADIETASTAAHNIADQVAAMAKVTKPWLFASHARKDAYDTLTANATSAQGEVASLMEVERKAASASDLKKLSGDLARISTIKARLNSLLASSSSASAVYNQ
jgi:class 3 adenylate cyclase